MDEPTQDNLFLDAVDAIVLGALAIIGGDPKARFAFFKRLLAVAPEVVGGAGGGGSPTTTRQQRAADRRLHVYRIRI